MSLLRLLGKGGDVPHSAKGLRVQRELDEWTSKVVVVGTGTDMECLPQFVLLVS